ncbi:MULTISPECIES: tetratricopeptide repeat protein [unclassified Meridianimarinicoccus]|uniref:tetratricopeptide repeat protein n=1 Tax=unclassified Meridianimarinicoccus TaxID=2923344 RepID=UPI001D02CFA8|nr:tetratricopeptide repeat protein [Fluviibacterium sp. MJW13]
MRLTRPLFALALAAQLTASAAAAGSSGAYLAARHAGINNDYVAAAEYFTRALSRDPNNPGLMDNVVTVNVNAGWIDRAVPVARVMIDSEMPSQVAAMVVLADMAAQGEFSQIVESFESGRSVGALVDGLTAAWAMLGAGQVSLALEKFDEVASQQGLKSFALYHKALALASVGDFEGADDIFSGRAEGPLQVSRRGVLAHVQVLSQLDRNEGSIDLIEQAFGANPAPIFAQLLEDLATGQQVPFTLATDATQGIGEVFHSIASALVGEAADGYTLVYARLASHLNPGNVDSLLLIAALLEDLEQYDLATRAYDAVPHDHAAFVTAEIGRADALLAAGRDDAAVEVLKQLAKAHPELLQVQNKLGDTLRRLDRFEEAQPVYDRAIALIETPEANSWPVFFSRGITLERIGQWEAAEVDFRKALELQPEQPQVLNYLGYSLVEMQTNLDEALDMIERAVAGRPNDGYITDSLGWVLYRMGRYDEAVGHMERAAALMPTDPIINDHLGDVYWSVGRQIEAQFQWRRALSFDPEEDEADRIRRKLEVGLDQVLEDEGAAPLGVVEDG